MPDKYVQRGGPTWAWQIGPDAAQPFPPPPPPTLNAILKSLRWHSWLRSLQADPHTGNRGDVWCSGTGRHAAAYAARALGKDRSRPARRLLPCKRLSRTDENVRPSPPPSPESKQEETGSGMVYESGGIRVRVLESEQAEQSSSLPRDFLARA